MTSSLSCSGSKEPKRTRSIPFMAQTASTASQRCKLISCPNAERLIPVRTISLYPFSDNWVTSAIKSSNGFERTLPLA